MITLRKLAQLPEGTRQRKIVRILEAVEREPASVSEGYLRTLLDFIATDGGIPTECAAHAEALAADPVIPDRRAVNTLRHAIMRALGVEPADWDLAPPAIDAGDRGVGLEGVVVFAEDIRSPFNLGSIVRTAAAFGVARVVATSYADHFQSRRFARSAMGAEQMLALSVAEEPPAESGELIALETGGSPIAEFRFPTRGVLLVGSEELGLSPAALSRANRRVSIPLAGAKGSLNVGVAVGIALSWWAANR